MNYPHRLIIAGLCLASTTLVLSACSAEDEPTINTVGAPSNSVAISSEPVEGLTEHTNTVSANASETNSIRIDDLLPVQGRPEVVVYKSPTCGCCQDWVTYLENEGFNVEAINHDNVDLIKADHGLTDPALKSCHTALVDGYLIEGHVPVNDIERLLAERPDVVGLTAPGMPMMSPGMGSLIPKDYDVLAFRKDGSARVYSAY